MNWEIKLVWLRVCDKAPPSPTAYGLLDSAEMERAQRFKVDKPHRVFVTARATLRSTLGAELGVDPRSLTFATGPHGKPRLDPANQLEFNLAHSGSVIAIALTRGTGIGIDVEESGNQVPALRLARRFFTEEEAAAVEHAPESSRLRVFHHLWTAKEAVLKATGTGLTVSVRNVEVHPDPDAPPRLHRIAGDRAAAHGWHLLRHERYGEWMVTIAHQGQPRDLQVTEFPGY